MRKTFLLAFGMFLACCIPLCAQVTVSGSNVQDVTGVPLYSGQWCAGATCLTVSNGAFSGSVTAGTYTVTVVNSSSVTILSVSGVVIGGSTYSWNGYTVPYGATFSGDGQPYIACQGSAQYTQNDSSPAGAVWVCVAQSGQLVWKFQGPPKPAGPGIISGLGVPTLSAIVPTIYIRTDVAAQYSLSGPTGSVSSTWNYLVSGACSPNIIGLGCTGATSAPIALANLGGISSVLTTPQTMAGPLTGPGFEAQGEPTYDVRAYGAKTNGITAYGGICNGTTTFSTTGGYSFVSADTGKHIDILYGATSTLGDYPYGTQHFGATITYVSATSVTLSSACPVSQSGLMYRYATDDYPAFLAAYNAMLTTVPLPAGGTIQVPIGKLYCPAGAAGSFSFLSQTLTVAGQFSYSSSTPLIPGPFILDMDCQVDLAPGIGTGILLENLYAPVVEKARFIGGGNGYTLSNTIGYPTSYTVTGGNLGTIQVVNGYIAGEKLTLASPPVGWPTTLTVLSAGLSGTQFEFTCSGCSNVGSTPFANTNSLTQSMDIGLQIETSENAQILDADCNWFAGYCVAQINGSVGTVISNVSTLIPQGPNGPALFLANFPEGAQVSHVWGQVVLNNGVSDVSFGSVQGSFDASEIGTTRVDHFENETSAIYPYPVVSINDSSQVVSFGSVGPSRAVSGTCAVQIRGQSSVTINTYSSTFNSPSLCVMGANVKVDSLQSFSDAALLQISNDPIATGYEPVFVADHIQILNPTATSIVDTSTGANIYLGPGSLPAVNSSTPVLTIATQGQLLLDGTNIASNTSSGCPVMEPSLVNSAGFGVSIGGNICNLSSASLLSYVSGLMNFGQDSFSAINWGFSIVNGNGYRISPASDAQGGYTIFGTNAANSAYKWGVSPVGQGFFSGVADWSTGVTTSAMGNQSSATPTNITGMTWTVANSKDYVLRCEIPITLAAGATVQFSLANSSGNAATSYSLDAQGSLGTAGVWGEYSTLAQTTWGTKTAASGAVNGTTVAKVWAQIQNASNSGGTLTLQTAANGTNNITVLANASCTLTQEN